MELHYVYYAIQKNGEPKVGATQNPKQRFRHYLSAKLLEVYECPWKCGDREIELQLKYFGKRDGGTHYAIMLKKGRNEKTNKKRSEGLKRAYKEGRRNQQDTSFRNTKEYRDNLSIAQLKIWSNSKRKEKQAKGEDNGLAVLKNEDVRFIRKHYYKTINQHDKIPNGMYSRAQLMKKFNCSKDVILNIINGKHYTSVK